MSLEKGGKEYNVAIYYVNNNAQSDSGDHEVHKEGCVWLPLITSKTRLGEFATCYGAVFAATIIYPDSNGCATCSPDCHTT